jgi:hypothetical protein
MTPHEFDTLVVGDTVVHVRTGRALVVTGVHAGEGRFFRKVVYAARRHGERRVVVAPEEFHRLPPRRVAAEEARG